MQQHQPPFLSSPILLSMNLPEGYVGRQMLNQITFETSSVHSNEIDIIPVWSSHHFSNPSEVELQQPSRTLGIRNRGTRV